MKCIRCGADLPDGSAFCDKCGADQRQAMTHTTMTQPGMTPPPTMTQPGMTPPPTMTQPGMTPPPTMTQPGMTPPQSNYGQAPGNYPPPMPAQPGGYGYNNVPQKKSGSKAGLIILGIVTGLIVIGVILFLIFGVFAKKDEPPVEETKTVTEEKDKPKEEAKVEEEPEEEEEAEPEEFDTYKASGDYKPEYADDFEVADYAKYDKPEDEDNLIGDYIRIEGRVEKFSDKDMELLVVTEDGNWIIMCGDNEFDGYKKSLGSLEGKAVGVFGQYFGMEELDGTKYPSIDFSVEEYKGTPMRIETLDGETVIDNGSQFWKGYEFDTDETIEALKYSHPAEFERVDLEVESHEQQVNYKPFIDDGYPLAFSIKSMRFDGLLDSYASEKDMLNEVMDALASMEGYEEKNRESLRIAGHEAMVTSLTAKMDGVDYPCWMDIYGFADGDVFYAIYTMCPYFRTEALKVCQEQFLDTFEIDGSVAATSASTGGNPKIEDFNWFIDIVKKTGEVGADYMADLAIAPDQDITNGDWKCMIFGYPDDIDDESDFFKDVQRLATLNVNMSGDKGTMTYYPYQFLDGPDVVQDDSGYTIEFKTKKNVEEMCLEGDATAEGMEVGFLKYNNTVYGLGFYHWQDGEESWVLLTK